MLKSILNAVFRNAKNDIERSASNAIANAVTKKVTDTVEQSVKQQTKEAEKAVAEAANAAGVVMINGVNYSKNYNVSRDHFAKIIRDNFDNYTIEENVPVSNIKPGASDAYKPLDFVLSSGGNPVAAIAIIPFGKQASTKAAALCGDCGVKYIRFYCMYENAESYVVERIKKALW